MHTEQLTLPITPRAPRDPDAALGVLLSLLAGRRWVHARDLGWSDRTLRMLAQVSQGQIISGQAGYCLIEEATPEEIRRAADWLRSQARQMLARSIAIRRRAHVLLHAPIP